jgi:dGTPase
VAQIGRELGLALGCDPDVVDAACLAHDLGHPPFGHNGETALDALAQEIGGFEGNAQTLRLLTRLEPKTIHPATGRSAGLNLTRATLDACVKYPWTRGRAGTSKFGAYDDDLDVFHWVRPFVEERGKCVEAQVMDLADDIAYCVHDVEDGLVGHYFEVKALSSGETVASVAERARAWYLADVEDGEIAEALNRLRAMPAWLDAFDGSARDLAALKSMTSRLIGRFSTAVEAATVARHGPGRLTRYAADLVIPRETVVEITALKAVASVFVMTAEHRMAGYQAERDLLQGLVEALVAGDGSHLEPLHRDAWERAVDDAGRLRAVIDQVAALTDSSAPAWHRRLSC